MRLCGIKRVELQKIEKSTLSFSDRYQLKEQCCLATADENIRISSDPGNWIWIDNLNGAILINRYSVTRRKFPEENTKMTS